MGEKYWSYGPGEAYGKEINTGEGKSEEWNLEIETLEHMLEGYGRETKSDHLVCTRKKNIFKKLNYSIRESL